MVIIDFRDQLSIFVRSFMFISEKGQGLVEYALILVLIAMIVIIAMAFLAPTIGNVFTSIGNTLESSI